MRDIPYTSELVALVLLLGVALFAGESLPLGITSIGVVSGFGVLLHAIGMILVYRTGRFLNFAQVQIGLVGAALFTALVQGELLLRAVDPLCGGCVGPDPSRTWEIANFLVAVVLGLVLSVLTSLVMYYLVVQRFANQPRLVLTIATVFVAQALVGLQSQLGWLLTTEDQREVERVNPFAASPLPWSFAIPLEPAQLRLDGIVTIVVGVVAVLVTAAYLKYSSTGVAVRAAAENGNRARTLGIDTIGVTARIWLLVGVLSGAAGILTAFGSGSSGSAAAASGAGSGENVAVLPVRTLVLILAIAVVARFASFTMAALAALVFGILQESTVWSWSSTAPLEVGFVVIIGVLLVLQRYRASRADADSTGTGGWRANHEVRPVPRELRGIPVVRAWTRTAWILAVVVVAGLPWVLSPSQTNIASIHLAYVIIGASLLVLTGWAGQVSLGQFAFAAVGAFVAGFSGLPLLVAVPVAGVGGAVAALLVGVPALKLRGLNLAIMTLAFAVSATTLFVTGDYLGRFLPTTMPRQSLVGIDLSNQRTFYYLTFVLAAVAVAAVLGLRRSRTGRVLIASRDNESTLQSYGVNLLRIRLAAFVFAGFLAAAAGAILASAYGAVTPAAFTPEMSLTLFAFTVIGGLGGIVGPVIGMVYLAVLTLLNANPLVQAVGSGLVGLFVLAALPGGLAQGLYDARDAMLRRVAARHRIVVPSLYADRDPAAAFERAPLDERRGRRSAAVQGRFEPDGQWALQRYGSDGAATGTNEPRATMTKERIGG
ncbi:hypothetical protein [Actinopolymorpha sp. B9G3]|uniref:ABC transporter permease subunit n=1 Tax=Actinopolymorpha sp. B9G3 TaxID=3158970 RepID=UPI0032D9324D